MASVAGDLPGVSRAIWTAREKRSVRGEPAGYELREEPHALRLACSLLCEGQKPSVHVQVVPGTLTKRGSASPTKQAVS